MKWCAKKLMANRCHSSFQHWGLAHNHTHFSSTHIRLVPGTGLQPRGRLHTARNKGIGRGNVGMSPESLRLNRDIYGTISWECPFYDHMATYTYA